MDRRSWLWRRKSSSDKSSPGETRETESSGSVSSHSERYSDEQEALRASSINASPNRVQSPEVSSKSTGGEGGETVTSLNEKLSAALLTISSKEDLIRQHAKVAEEAVLGWEKAEKEVAALKRQLEAANRKSSALEDRVSHLDGALKECVRQCWQLRENQELKVQEALVEETKEWESGKFELESRVIELQAQLEAKAEASASVTQELQSKLEVLVKENSALRVELLVCSEDLEMQMLERELSTKAAETASKQHLESIKKMAKLEAECRKLRAAARKSSSFRSQKLRCNSVGMESLTDSQSDSGERLLSLDNEPSFADSWASALISELDQFKNEKTTRKLTSSVEFDLMDDFLEMEKLAAMPESNCGISSFDHKAGSDHTVNNDSSSRSELEALRKQMAQLEEVVEKMATEKAELEMALNETQNQLKISCDQLTVAQDKLLELQRLLNLVYGEKNVLETEVEAAEAKRTEVEYQLKSANMEVGKLQEKVSLLEGKLEEEKALSTEFAARCQHMEAIEANREELELQLKQSRTETGQLQEKVRLLEGKVEEEKELFGELVSRCQNLENLEAKNNELKSQLESGYIETGELREKVGMLERKVEEERAISAELLAKCQSLDLLDAKRMELESQLNSAHLEVAQLKATVNSLEGKVEEERALSAEFAANLEAVEAKRKDLVAQLESAHTEIGRLHEKLGLLEKQAQEEKVLSQEFAAKCQDLEGELSRKKQQAMLQLLVGSNGDLKIDQEKDNVVAANKLAECQKVAAGKLADCQKTIASLNQQLKSFAMLDDFMLGLEEPELDGGSLHLRTEDYRTLSSYDFPENSTSSSLCNGREWGSHHLPRPMP